MTDDLQRLREGVAVEYKLALYRQYSEKQAAGFIGIDYTTLKRKRLAGMLPYVDKGGGSVGYMGFMIADVILFGIGAKWQEPPEVDHVDKAQPAPPKIGSQVQDTAGRVFGRKAP